MNFTTEEQKKFFIDMIVALTVRHDDKRRLVMEILQLIEQDYYLIPVSDDVNCDNDIAHNLTTKFNEY